ncbi:Uncharacterised protein [Pseudomonas aeruginosa]|nr:Uncharacterised protein [Pseudomonas aeruginosa]
MSQDDTPDLATPQAGKVAPKRWRCAPSRVL